MGSRPSTAGGAGAAPVVGEEEDEFPRLPGRRRARSDRFGRQAPEKRRSTRRIMIHARMHYAARATRRLANICCRRARRVHLDRYGNTPLGVALRNQRDDVVGKSESTARIGRPQLSMPQSSSTSSSWSRRFRVWTTDVGRRWGEIDLGDCDKRTALHLAKHGHLDVVTWLVDSAGADATHKIGGATPRWTTRCGLQGLGEFLEKKGACGAR